MTWPLTRFLFQLCRDLQVAHPNRLPEILTAEELADWWFAWLDEPWGEHRSDLRAAAAAHYTWGSEHWTMAWPYWEPPLSPDEVEEQIASLEAEFRKREHGHRGKDRHSTGSADGDPTEGVC